MRRDAKAYLWDIADAAETIRAFAKDKSLSDYVADEMLRAAIERKFGIIGEALSQLLRLFPQYATHITLPEQIISFRNQIIHGYATVRDDMVWEIIQTYLPRLHKEETQLMNEPDPSAP